MYVLALLLLLSQTSAPSLSGVARVDLASEGIEGVTVRGIAPTVRTSWTAHRHHAPVSRSVNYPNFQFDIFTVKLASFETPK